MNAPTNDASQIDLLVDGELPAEARRALLSRLDASPDGWRRCALAFLEAQAWRESFAGAAVVGAFGSRRSRRPARIAFGSPRGWRGRPSCWRPSRPGGPCIGPGRGRPGRVRPEAREPGPPRTGPRPSSPASTPRAPRRRL